MNKMNELLGFKVSEDEKLHKEKLKELRNAANEEKKLAERRFEIMQAEKYIEDSKTYVPPPEKVKSGKKTSGVDGFKSGLRSVMDMMGEFGEKANEINAGMIDFSEGVIEKPNNKKVKKNRDIFSSESIGLQQQNNNNDIFAMKGVNVPTNKSNDIFSMDGLPQNTNDMFSLKGIRIPNENEDIFDFGPKNKKKTKG